MDLQQLWRHQTFVAFDTETTGQYPLTAEICEIAAVKWRDGQIIDRFQTLLKPSHLMDDFVISIHHISNEMVATAPLMSERIHEFHRFISEGIPIAHHAPFDLGFLSIEFERFNLALPENPAMCSSLLARNTFASPNHRLQTLIQFLNLPQGQAHRALDDAEACLGVGLKVMEHVGPDATLAQVFGRQGTPLYWPEYSIQVLCQDKVGAAIVESIRKNAHLEIVYGGGSKPGVPRQIKPEGLVRNAQGDYLVATDYNNPEQRKRFYLNKIVSASVVY
jgi:DNA polymerase-3 subunit epsilon